MAYKKYPNKLDGDIVLGLVARLVLSFKKPVWALDAYTGNYYGIKTYKGKSYITEEHKHNYPPSRYFH